KSIVFITHKLREVLAVADRITVLRLGRVVGHTTPVETSEQALATMMVGRTVALMGARAEAGLPPTAAPTLDAALGLGEAPALTPGPSPAGRGETALTADQSGVPSGPRNPQSA